MRAVEELQEDMKQSEERWNRVEEDMKDMRRTIATLRFRSDVARLLVHVARWYANDGEKTKADKFNVPLKENECEQWAASQFCSESFARLCDSSREQEKKALAIEEGNLPVKKIETSLFRFHRASQFWRALGIEAEEGICICRQLPLQKKECIDAAFCRDLIETCDFVAWPFSSCCNKALVAQIARACLARFEGTVLN